MLVVIFCCAWAYDYWPNWALIEASVAVVAVLSQGVLLWSAAKRGALVEASDHDGKEESLDSLLSYVVGAPDIEPFEEFTAHSPSWTPHRFHRYQASQAANWALYIAMKEGVNSDIQNLRAASNALALPKAMNEWIVAEHAPDIFNVEAGPFVIEHFHGKTNIRILDPSRVTVELSKDIEGSLELKAFLDPFRPSYQ